MRFRVEIPHRTFVLASHEELMSVFEPREGPWGRLLARAESAECSLEFGDSMALACSWVQGEVPEGDPAVHEFLTAVETYLGRYRG